MKLIAALSVKARLAALVLMALAGILLVAGIGLYGLQLATRSALVVAERHLPAALAGRAATPAPDAEGHRAAAGRRGAGPAGRRRPVPDPSGRRARRAVADDPVLGADAVGAARAGVGQSAHRRHHRRHRQHCGPDQHPGAQRRGRGGAGRRARPRLRRRGGRGAHAVAPQRRRGAGGGVGRRFRQLAPAGRAAERGDGGVQARLPLIATPCAARPRFLSDDAQVPGRGCR
jgi:hypothetical protein